MASFRKLKSGSTLAEVYVKGLRDSRTFDTARQAKEWAAQRETELRQQAETSVDVTKSVRDVLQRYAAEVSTRKRTGRNEQVRINRICKSALADVRLIDLRPGDIAQWRDEKLKTANGSSVCREMNILHHAFEIARKEWGWVSSNPVSDVARHKKSPPRDRRISDQEIATMLLAFGYYNEEPPRTKSHYVAIAFLFAIETAMRAGEICSLTQESIQGRIAHLAMTKNGTARKVPLSTRALELLALLPNPGPGEQLFNTTPEQLSALFRKARMKTDIADLHFHDTRHEAITRLAQKLNVLDLARMVGHSDIKMLQIYYNATPEDLAARLD
jgi:integrase